MIPKVVTIAGSDSSGGAGLQADLKTFQEFGTFGFSAITSIVTMDPDQHWSHEVTPIATELVEKQLKTIFSTKKIAALKTGMLGSPETIQLVKNYLMKNKVPQIVIDPVIACKGTTELLQPENVAALKKELLPLATITTPNLVEAGILSEMGDLTSLDEMKTAAKRIAALGSKNVIVKGGRRLEGTEAFDVFYDGQDFTLLQKPQLTTNFNHGAGCTFAAAITASLAKGASIEKAIAIAKEFVYFAIKNGLEINQYLGHVWHGAYLEAEKRMTFEGES